jgi:hypothetical protein
MLKNNTHPLLLRAAHFAVLIPAFFLCTILLSAIQIRHMPESDLADGLPAFSGQQSQTGFHAIFFHDNSPMSNKMQYNLQQAAPPCLYCSAANVVTHPHYCADYRLSSVPTLLIFNEEEEILRIMGLVSPSNLKKIYAKLR